MTKLCFTCCVPVKGRTSNITVWNHSRVRAKRPWAPFPLILSRNLCSAVRFQAVFISQQIPSKPPTIFVLHHIPFGETLNATDKSTSWKASVLCFCWSLTCTVDEADSLNEGNVRYCCTNTKVLSSWYKLGRKQLLYEFLCFYLYLATFRPSLKHF